MKRHLSLWIGLLIAIVFVCTKSLAELPDGMLHLYFLDVEQGDGYLLITPSGNRIVVDAGPANNIVAPFRKAIGWMNDNIDMVMLTHFDKDHAEGMLALLANFHVKKLVITGVEQRTALQHMIMARVVADHIPVTIAYSATDFAVDHDVVMDLIWPMKSLAGKYGLDYILTQREKLLATELPTNDYNW